MAINVYKEWLGIPEEQTPPDHYALLNLSRFEDDRETIREHYLERNAEVRKYATGRYQNESQELLNELARAMLCLTDAQRKREYDISLGRKEVRKAVARSLEEVLVAQGKVNEQQIARAKDFSEGSGLDLRDALVQLRIVDQVAATQALAESEGLPYFDLTSVAIDRRLLAQVPEPLARRYSLVPIFVDDGQLLVGCTRPFPPQVEDELRLRAGVPVRSVIATPAAIDRAITTFYSRTEDDGETGAAPALQPSEPAQAKKPAPPKRPAAKPTRAPAQGASGAGGIVFDKRLAIISACLGLALGTLVVQAVFPLGSSWKAYPLLALPQIVSAGVGLLIGWLLGKR